jgi:hypothetical protein
MLTPATPPGSLVPRPPHALALDHGSTAHLIDKVRTAYFEPQDRAGLVTLLASVASAMSTSLALAISLTPGTFLGLLRSDFAWYFHNVSQWLWALPIVFGLASARRMPQWLAWFSIGLAVIYYGWDWLPIPPQLPPLLHSASTLVKAGYILVIALTAVPILLRGLLRRENAP